MALTREKKEAVLAKLEDISKSAATLVFVKFHGLSVTDANTLRKTLRGNGVGYTVAKKTLLRRALQNVGFEGEMPVLEGEVAIAYGEDLIAPARGISGFVKKFKDSLAILGGVFEKRYMGQAEMVGIASIPSREVLLAQIANLLNSPMQRLAVGLQAVADKKTV